MSTAAEVGERLIANAAARTPRFGTGYTTDASCKAKVGLGELALVCARSAAGKSTLMLNIIANTPQIPTVVFNMEMTPERQMEWLAGMSYDLPVEAQEVDDVLADPRHPEHRACVSAMRSAIRKFQSLSFVLPKRPSVSDLAVEVDAIEESTGVRPQRVFIDHLSLMHGGKTYDAVNENCAALKSWAMNDNLSVWSMQQVGRQGDGSGQRNDGHLPLTISSGEFGGEADADFLFGVYRPDKHPDFLKSRHEFKREEDYERMLRRKMDVKGQTIFQVVKNRPFGDLLLEGTVLYFDRATRRLVEYPQANRRGA